MSNKEDEAFLEFTSIRFAENDGNPFCPFCGCTDPYVIPTRRKWKCRACRKQFSATSGTIFAYRKISFIDLIKAVRLAKKSGSTLSMAQELGCQYRTAFSLRHKIRSSNKGDAI